jgi:hypothetical protein
VEQRAGAAEALDRRSVVVDGGRQPAEAEQQVRLPAPVAGADRRRQRGVVREPPLVPAAVQVAVPGEAAGEVPGGGGQTRGAGLPHRGDEGGELGAEPAGRVAGGAGPAPAGRSPPERGSVPGADGAGWQPRVGGLGQGEPAAEGPLERRPPLRRGVLGQAPLPGEDPNQVRAGRTGAARPRTARRAATRRR